MTVEDTEPLIIHGIAVDRGLLEARPLRRCQLEECEAYCCAGGVYISVEQVHDILAHADLIRPHLPPERRDAQTWFDWETEPETDHPEGGEVMGTNVVDDPTHPAGFTCVFLRPDRKCALHAASLAAGEHSWRFKPFYCALHPLTYDEHVLALSEGSEMYAEGGSCNRLAPGASVPIYELYAEELKLALGADGYRALEAVAARQA